MRIIDKNKDYYDYFQNIYIDNTFTFDRRGSHPYTRDEFIRNPYYGHPTHLLLQVCNNFWLIKITWIATQGYYRTEYDYSLELENKWVDYNAPRKQLSLLGIIKATEKAEHDKLICDYNKQFRLEGTRYIPYFCTPILKDIGIPSVVDGFEIYKALEEFFGTEKTASERSEAVGTTNEDKILSHGFDTKSSFRGKNT